MKLRTLILIALAIAAGYWLATKRHADDPDIVVGPRDESRGGSAGRFVSGQAQRLADQATAKSLDAIRRARGAIRERIGDRQADEAVWN
jgi:hypothetical protein